jgi:hypothetical protein
MSPDLFETFVIFTGMPCFIFLAALIAISAQKNITATIMNAFIGCSGR